MDSFCDIHKFISIDEFMIELDHIFVELELIKIMKEFWGPDSEEMDRLNMLYNIYKMIARRGHIDIEKPYPNV